MNDIVARDNIIFLRREASLASSPATNATGHGHTGPQTGGAVHNIARSIDGVGLAQPPLGLGRKICRIKPFINTCHIEAGLYR
jgi:hypothetical protein